MRFHEFPSAIALFIETPPNMARGPILSQASLGSGLFFEESGHPRLRKNPATLLVNPRDRSIDRSMDRAEKIYHGREEEIC